MKKRVIPVLVFIIYSFTILSAKAEGFIENYEETIDNIIFEHVFSDLPTFEESFEKELGVLGDITGNVYVSAGQAYIRLPAHVKTRYDTTLEPFSGNVVEMAVEPYNGEGPEFKLIFGFNLSVVYDPPGPSWLTGKASFGDFDTGFNFEGDFTPPIDGEWEATSSESFTGSIGLKKALSFDIGVNVRFNLQGKMIKASTWEDDPYAEIQDIGERGIVLRDPQHSPQFTVKDNDMYTSLDYQVDFESYDFYYVTAITAEIDSIIMGFSFMGASWTWEFPTVVPLESKEVDFTIWTNEDESDDTVYYMTRVIAPGGVEVNDYPFFEISSNSLMGEPSQSVVAQIALSHSVKNPPRGYSIQPAQLRVYDEENNMVYSVPVTAADFQRESIMVPLTLPSFTEQHYTYKLSLRPPDLFQWYRISHTTPRNATLTFSRQLPDLYPVKLNISPRLPGNIILEHGSYAGAINIVEVFLKNSGQVPSTTTEIKLWLYEGLPSVPAFTSTNQLIQNAALIGVNPVPPIQPNGGSQHEFTFILPKSLEGKIVTYIVEVDGSHLIPEITEGNNRAFTTVEVQKTTQGIQWVLGSNHYAFSSLAQVFDVPTGRAVADMSEDIAGRAETLTNEMFVEELEALTYLESIVLEELEDFIPSVYLEAATGVNIELSQKITEVQMTGLNEISILEVLNIKTKFINEINYLWQATIIGTVKESESELIPSAEIHVRYQNGLVFETHTNPVNGTFQFNYLPPGNVEISASAPGHINYTDTLTLNPLSKTTREIMLPSILGSIKLTIEDSDTDLPIKGANVEINNIASITDSKGEVIFNKMSPGNIVIIVERKGYEKFVTQIDLKPEEEITEQIELNPKNIHDISIIALNIIPRTISLGTNVSIMVTFGNEGMWIEDTELILYTNSTIIAEYSASLTKKNYQTHIIEWPTSRIKPAKYFLAANLMPVFGENNTADNSYDYGLVHIIDDEPPIINSIESNSTGMEVFFQVKASDNHKISSIFWELGDGTSKEGESIIHTYDKSGDYSVKVTITDPSGNISEDLVMVSVDESKTVSSYYLLSIGLVFLLIILGYWMKSKKLF